MEKNSWKNSIEIKVERKAPRIAPGIDSTARLSAILYFILRCCAYEITEEILVEVTPTRLVLEIWDGLRPISDKAGAKIIPPPTPIKEPNIPPPIPIAIKITKEVTSNISHQYNQENR
jgi:hypothetical protein